MIVPRDTTVKLGQQISLQMNVQVVTIVLKTLKVVINTLAQLELLRKMLKELHLLIAFHAFLEVIVVKKLLLWLKGNVHKATIV